MTRVRARGEDVRRFILDHVGKQPHDICRVTAQRFGITRQAVNRHLQKLTSEHALEDSGKTRSRTYKLSPQLEWRGRYEITPELAEDQIWSRDVRPTLGMMPENVMDIWHYGFTEMFNNAMDHSAGRSISILVRKTAVSTEMLLMDDGVGIFRKIKSALNLLDERHAILELSKGKLTTDPKHHTGEGIFFTSRMFDKFDILSGGVYFTHQFGDEMNWALEIEGARDGTAVWMNLHNHTARTTRKIFDQYSSGDDYGFNKTVVPVRLAQYGDDKLISRSQAKRVLARVELFKVVMFDFEGVESIGQAFADEIFRVFARRHSEIELHAINANPEVKRIIARAKSGA